PSTAGRAARDRYGRCGSHVRDREAVVVNPGATALAVQQNAVPGESQPARQGRDKAVVSGCGEGMPQSHPRAHPAAAVVVVVRKPVEITFNAQHKAADLVVEADLSASGERRIARTGEVQPSKGVSHIACSPGSAEIAAQVEPGPTELRNRGRRLGIDR